jgi:hypothetical protein
MTGLPSSAKALAARNIASIAASRIRNLVAIIFGFSF